jgi:4a-hydroxytetrahydrobiopterin dehydratase
MRQAVPGEYTMTTDLISRKCQACESGAGKVGADDLAFYLQQTPGWEIDGSELRRMFKFKNYYEALAFVNATAWISHRENHHPDIELGYNKVTMRYRTHAVGGLTQNDFICAAKINELLSI